MSPSKFERLRLVTQERVQVQMPKQIRSEREQNYLLQLKMYCNVYGRLAKYPVKFLSSKAMSAPNQYLQYTRFTKLMLC